jgi:signal transduction histidine kinase/CheY-like chemotaxis protein
MTEAEGRSERVLVLAPLGRDAAIAGSILAEAGMASVACFDLPCLCAALAEGGGVAVVVEEALFTSDLSELSRWIENQPAWSDFPFVLLAQRGGGLERNPSATRLSATLGNVSFLERPFHPTTLVSVVRTALRGRMRQYEARERMDEIRRAELLLERRVQERTAELESANRQLASEIAEREKVQSALRQAQRLEAVGQLTSGVAHDFNNLLTVVLGNVRQMQKTPSDDPKLARRLAMMAEAAERGAKLTAQMLAFSRRQKLEPRAVNLNETVESMRDLLQSTIGGSVRIQTTLAPGLWPAMIDPTQIELVILNLAINGRDAMAVGGALSIETANVTLGEPRRPEEPGAGDYVMVAVGDTGSGMTAEVLAKAFEPFFTTKAVGKGSGLGLSQVFGLAKQSGGGVRIDTEEDVGTVVRVYLPRAPEAVARPRDADRIAPRNMRGRTVLLVDDDDAVREISAGILDDLGYAVVEAGSGGAALEALDNCPQVDLVLLDYAMPGMNGAEVEREIRARRPHLPVLFATGYADAAALVGASEERVIQKPFDEFMLAAKLDHAAAAAELPKGA